MTIVKQLKPDQYGRLTNIFEDEFGSDVPLPHNSTIFAIFEDGKMSGFILCETLQMVGQVYVIPEKRDKSTHLVMQMLKTVKEKFAGKENVGAVASQPRFRKLFEAMGMEPIKGDFFRRNI